MLDKIAFPTRDRIAALVDAILAQKPNPRQVSATDALVDAGLTSMDMVGLMLAVEAEFDLTIPAAEITPNNFRSIAAIEAMIGKVQAETA